MLDIAALAAGLVSELGYVGLFIGLVLSSMGIPVPSEALLPLAGILVSQGRMDLTTVIIVSTLGQATGAVFAYWIGAKGGVALLHRYGKYVFFSKHEMKVAHKLFEKYGTGITFIGRCLPGVRSYIAFPPGIAGMPFLPFFLMTILGSLVWTLFWVLIGYYLADQLKQVEGVVHVIAIIVAVALVVAVFWYLRRRIRKG